MRIKSAFYLVMVMASVMLLNGCAVIFQKGRKSDLEKIAALESELAKMKDARSSLEDSLKKEIDDAMVKLEMKDKGLVITVLAEVLFDSGKANLKQASSKVLDKVSEMLGGKLAEFKVGVEGHTDNDPIVKSGWKSNWELSAHRALTVLEYLVAQGIAPERLNLLGFGEFQPVAPNDTKANKFLNRRVEIVVYPKKEFTKKELQDLK